MKYKIYEKLTDFFRSQLFTKTNLAVIAVLSVVLNVAMAGLTYKEHKDYVIMSSLYACEETAYFSDTTAVEKTHRETTANVSGDNESLSQTEASTEKTVTDEAKEQTTTEAVSDDAQQGTYYVTNSGTKYHKGSCGYLSKSRNAISLSDARARGYTPCSRCIK